METIEMNWTEDGLNRLADKIADAYKYNRQMICAERIVSVIPELTDRERRCLYEKFENDKTYEEIGKLYSVTRSRIQQIVDKAIRKLWNPRRNLKYTFAHPDAYIKLLNEHNELKEKYGKLVTEYNSLLDSYMKDKKYLMSDSFKEMYCNDIMGKKLLELDMSVRAYNCLTRAGVKTVFDLSQMTVQDLMKVRNLGRRTLLEIVDLMAGYGIEIKDENKIEDRCPLEASVHFTGDGVYTVHFDDTSMYWTKYYDHNLSFLLCSQDKLNDILRFRGYVLLNEVFDALGMHRTAEGCVVGWLYKNKDTVIDFGLKNSDIAENQKFMERKSNTCILVFKTDGYILDKIKR